MTRHRYFKAEGVITSRSRKEAYDKLRILLTDENDISLRMLEVEITEPVQVKSNANEGK